MWTGLWQGGALGSMIQVSRVFLVVEPSNIIFLDKILYPKRRIESYSIMGTIVVPNKILLWYSCGIPSHAKENPKRHPS